MYLHGLSEDGNTLTLKRFTGTFSLPDFPLAQSTGSDTSQQSVQIITGLVFDVETTGFDLINDKVIEIGLRQFQFDQKTGNVIKIGEAYSGFEDPEAPLPEEIKKVTKLSDEMLKNQKIDWATVARLFESSEIIIAHNAAFDRAFADRYLPLSREKTWACSCYGIDWLSKGFSGKSLGLLANYHGFFYEAHRALSDSDALLHLLSIGDRMTQKPYLHELYEEAQAPQVQIIAAFSPFETKDLLKKRGYRWNNVAKAWFCVIKTSKQEAEIKWLEEKIYRKPFPGSVKLLRKCDNFKPLA